MTKTSNANQGCRVVTGADGQRHVASIRRRFVRCGDASCSTCRDGAGHGPYLYRRYRDGGRIREIYIGRV